MSLPVLASERVRLRPFGADDLDPFTRFMTDANATHYMLFRADQKTEAGARELFDRTTQSYDTDQPLLVWAITRADQDASLGWCGLWPREDKGSYEIFYTLLEPAQGQGLATEAVKLLVAHAIGKLRANSVIAFVITGNAASVRVTRRAGFKDAGPMEQDGRKGRCYRVDRPGD